MHCAFAAAGLMLAKKLVNTHHLHYVDRVYMCYINTNNNNKGIYLFLLSFFA